MAIMSIRSEMNTPNQPKHQQTPYELSISIECTHHTLQVLKQKRRKRHEISELHNHEGSSEGNQSNTTSADSVLPLADHEFQSPR